MEPVQIRNILTINSFLTLLDLRMYPVSVSEFAKDLILVSSVLMKMFANVGAHLVPIAVPIC